MVDFNIVLYDDFEILDAFGPAEVIARLPELYVLRCYSLDGGIVASSRGIQVNTLPLDGMESTGIVLLPGGMGTRILVERKDFIDQIARASETASHVLTVCTGSALLAKTGLLNGREATTNKRAFAWVASNGPEVRWARRARWVRDGKYYTASGVSAGIDMTLGFIRDMHGLETSITIAHEIEYVWNEDKENDPFAI